ncbi:hypothetical protein DAEQUDRAFT_729282 [Daedalea quercina L-15889]|uniref:Uncharacterized protein n=1 Tax=Daedalea quercina L-15889 TaxID=1314783 RepID=A0A165NQJ5_9APHY|nr:hypothetical protein DAEQUDRAFT_729282 [Daedalea quercina L-15889]
MRYEREMRADASFWLLLSGSTPQSRMLARCGSRRSKARKPLMGRMHRDRATLSQMRTRRDQSKGHSTYHLSTNNLLLSDHAYMALQVTYCTSGMLQARFACHVQPKAQSRYQASGCHIGHLSRPYALGRVSGGNDDG